MTVVGRGLALRDARLRRAPQGEEQVLSQFRLILVSHESPNRLAWPVRRRTGDRLILGFRSPFLSTGLRPPFHRTRTVAWAAKRARLRKEGLRWRRSTLAWMCRRIGWTSW